MKEKFLAVCLMACVMGCLVACGKTDVENQGVADMTGELNVGVSTESGNSNNGENTVDRGTTEEGKQIITLGTFGNNLAYLEKAVNRFNRDNKNYEIQIVNYTEGCSDDTPGKVYDEAREKFKLDLVTGKGADIIDMSYFGFGPKLSMQKGIVEDLYPYLESSDTVNTDDLNPHVLSVYEVDGKLPCFPTHFDVGMMYGKTSEIGAIDSWTPDELIAIYDSKPEGTKLFFEETKFGVLMTMISDRENYYNQLTGECHFDSEEFKQILEFVNRFPDADAAGDANRTGKGPSPAEMFYGDKVLLRGIDIGRFSDIRDCLEGVAENEDITYIGDPRRIGKCGSRIWGWNLYGISSKSEHKEGAWKFIESLLSDFYQVYGYDWGLPIRNSAYEQKLEAAIGAKEVTKEEADIAAEMISGAVGQDNWRDDEEIWNIIWEESGAYFSGQKSVDEVADIIQSRVSIYVMEHI